MKCIWCEKRLINDDEVVHIGGHGFAHDDICSIEYFREVITGPSFAFEKEDNNERTNNRLNK